MGVRSSLISEEEEGIKSLGHAERAPGTLAYLKESLKVKVGEQQVEWDVVIAPIILSFLSFEHEYENRVGYNFDDKYIRWSIHGKLLMDPPDIDDVPEIHNYFLINCFECKDTLIALPTGEILKFSSERGYCERCHLEYCYKTLSSRYKEHLGGWGEQREYQEQKICRVRNKK